jgi:hypothetical protein
MPGARSARLRHVPKSRRQPSLRMRRRTATVTAVGMNRDFPVDPALATCRWSAGCLGLAPILVGDDDGLNLSACWRGDADVTLREPRSPRQETPP